MGNEQIWEKVRGQIVLGEEGYVEQIIGYIKGKSDIQEIPKQQRYLNRPGLDDLFPKRGKINKAERNKLMYQTIVEPAYTQKEIADYLGLHYSTVSRLIRAYEKSSK